MMKPRKIAVAVVGVLLCSAIGYLTFAIAAKRTRQREVADKMASLPAVKLAYTDGAVAPLAVDGKPLVLVLFNSGCEHCQYEAEAIRQHITDFASTQIVLVSAEEPAAAKQFAAVSGLGNATNVRFATITHADLTKTFGNVSFPSVYIYSAKGKLLKHFRGETSPQAILKVVSAISS